MPNPPINNTPVDFRSGNNTSYAVKHMLPRHRKYYQIFPSVVQPANKEIMAKFPQGKYVGRLPDGEGGAYRLS